MKLENEVRPCPSPTKVPVPLPRGLIPQLAAQRKLLLFLDYDGTISEITPDLFHAAPIAGAREVITALPARHDRIPLALISGREIHELLRLLKTTPGAFRSSRT